MNHEVDGIDSRRAAAAASDALIAGAFMPMLIREWQRDLPAARPGTGQWKSRRSR
jgi:hypothetical protein